MAAQHILWAALVFIRLQQRKELKQIENRLPPRPDWMPPLDPNPSRLHSTPRLQRRTWGMGPLGLLAAVLLAGSPAAADDVHSLGRVLNWGFRGGAISG